MLNEIKAMTWKWLDEMKQTWDKTRQDKRKLTIWDQVDKMRLNWLDEKHWLDGTKLTGWDENDQIRWDTQMRREWLDNVKKINR